MSQTNAPRAESLLQALHTCHANPFRSTRLRVGLPADVAQARSEPAVAQARSG
jgi:hypothetical protein